MWSFVTATTNSHTMGTLFQEHCKREASKLILSELRVSLPWCGPLGQSGDSSFLLSRLIIASLSLEWTGTVTPEKHQVTLPRTSRSFQDSDTYILCEALICPQAERISPPSPVVHKAMEKSAHSAGFPESGLFVARAQWFEQVGAGQELGS